MGETKTCRDCRRVKSIDEFAENSLSKDGRMHICNDCQGNRSAVGQRRSQEAKKRGREEDMQDAVPEVFGKVVVDLFEHEDVYDALRDAAHDDMRTVELEAAWIIRECLIQKGRLGATGEANAKAS